MRIKTFYTLAAVAGVLLLGAAAYGADLKSGGSASTDSPQTGSSFTTIISTFEDAAKAKFKGQKETVVFLADVKTAFRLTTTTKFDGMPSTPDINNIAELLAIFKGKTVAITYGETIKGTLDAVKIAIVDEQSAPKGAVIVKDEKLGTTELPKDVGGSESKTVKKGSGVLKKKNSTNGTFINNANLKKKR